MALVRLAKINDNSFWAAWKIEETIASLMQECSLNNHDLLEWELIHHSRKQVEWLSSRAALASILRVIGAPPPSIRKDEKGKPFLLNSSYCISLANSYPYGVAILHQHQAVGIDIEQPNSKLSRIQHKFLNANEITTVRNRLPYQCIYWCVKEALYKLYGRKQLSLKDNITVHSVHLEESIRVDATININSQVTSYMLEGIILDSFFVIYSVI